MLDMTVWNVYNTLIISILRNRGKNDMSVSLKDWISDLPFWYKALSILLFVAGVGLLIAGLVVENQTPNDHGRWDVVYSEVGGCLCSCAGACFGSDVLFLIAKLVSENDLYGWFLAIIKWVCIIGGIVCLILTPILGGYLANNAISEYDRLYSDLIVSIV